MKKIRHIGFKNFRKFTELQQLSLGNLTLMTGGNNSGKSTIVKAALLVLNFLQKRKITMEQKGLLGFEEERKFFFDMPNVHISSFERAINNSCAPASDKIVFCMGIDNFNFEIEVIAAKDPKKTYGSTSVIKIEDTKESIVYRFDFVNYMMYITFVAPEREESASVLSLDELNAEANKLKAKVKETQDFAEIAKINMRLADVEKSIKSLSTTTTLENKEIGFTLSSFPTSTENYAITDLLKSFILVCHEDINDKSAKDAKTYILGKEKNIQSSINSMTTILRDMHIEYISAHAASQNAVFTSFDKNDYTAQTIHSFVKADIKTEKGNRFFDFIMEWMDSFEIGESINIETLANEAYSVRIIDKKRSMPLADKGMGSIQLMTLLLRLATLMKVYQYASIKPTILIEEPEQNLHPATQSKLAVMFDEVRAAGFNVIVETHSEYFVRKMQHVVASRIKKDGVNLYEINDDVKVYFFFKELGEEEMQSTPISMDFQENGRFVNNFGTGFFDEALRLNRDLNKIERE